MQASPKEPPLPPVNVKRWTRAHKAQVVEAVNSGAVTAEFIHARYGIGPDELRSWLRRFSAGGARALQESRVADFRG